MRVAFVCVVLVAAAAAAPLPGPGEGLDDAVVFLSVDEGEKEDGPVVIAGNGLWGSTSDGKAKLQSQGQPFRQRIGAAGQAPLPMSRPPTKGAVPSTVLPGAAARAARTKGEGDAEKRARTRLHTSQRTQSVAHERLIKAERTLSALKRSAHRAKILRRSRQAHVSAPARGAPFPAHTHPAHTVLPTAPPHTAAVAHPPRAPSRPVVSSQDDDAAMLMILNSHPAQAIATNLQRLSKDEALATSQAHVLAGQLEKVFRQRSAEASSESVELGEGFSGGWQDEDPGAVAANRRIGARAHQAASRRWLTEVAEMRRAARSKPGGETAWMKAELERVRPQTQKRNLALQKHVRWQEERAADKRRKLAADGEKLLGSLLLKVQQGGEQLEQARQSDSAVERNLARVAKSTDLEQKISQKVAADAHALTAAVGRMEQWLGMVGEERNTGSLLSPATKVLSDARRVAAEAGKAQESAQKRVESIERMTKDERNQVRAHVKAMAKGEAQSAELPKARSSRYQPRLQEDGRNMLRREEPIVIGEEAAQAQRLRVEKVFADSVQMTTKGLHSTAAGLVAAQEQLQKDSSKVMQEATDTKLKSFFARTKGKRLCHTSAGGIVDC